ncbi:MAG: MltA domain-containing protein [Deltaproteobacteria bacterium]|jgi:membrane-bound lytic murein transglycosylase A|nr:MltA domain-containing protein [Deltaproteobacteria bacterium]
MRKLLIKILLVSLLCLGGCSELKTVLPPPPPPPPPPVVVQPAPAPEPPKQAEKSRTGRFINLENFTLRVLPRGEAAVLARRMSPQQQGLAGWNDLRPGLEQSLDYVKTRPADSVAVRYPSSPQLWVTWGELRASLTRLLELLPQLDANPGLLAERFRWLALGPEFGFTGYYEPTIFASYRPSPMYAYPLYAKPPDLQPGKLFYDRHAIDRQRVLAGRGLELAWVRDEVDAFFLQIQGSGRLVFPDGETRHVLYAGKNGHPYVPIGAVLRDQGFLAENDISMTSIRGSLLNHPHEKGDLLDHNPSYVFFRLADQGPIGSMGKILTPRVSLAVDPEVLPYGSVVFFSTNLPNYLGVHNRPLYGLGLPQDSGGAIKGRRVDYFMGAGKAAEHVAGHLHQAGMVYLLLVE